MAASDSTPILASHSPNYMSTLSHPIHIEGTPDELKSSPVRRTFCLIVLFDFVLSFIVWVLYARVYPNNLKKEVIQFNFYRSLFDTVVVATCKFLYLEIIYGAVKTKNYWWIAVSTCLISIYVLVKAFLFKEDMMANYNNMSIILKYFIIVLVFIFSWVETLFLIYRVFPMEKAALSMLEYERLWNTQQLSNNSGSGSQVSIDNVLRWDGLRSTRHISRSRMSPSMVSDDGEFATPHETRSSSPTRFRIKEIITLATDQREIAWRLSNIHEGWTYCSGDAMKGFVSYRVMPEFSTKVYKIECLLNVSAELLYKDMIFNCEESPMWNPQVATVKKLESISDNVDIIYNSTNEAMRGYVSPRDFVLIRVWGRVGKSYIISSKSYIDPQYPPKTNIVRADQGINLIRLDNIMNDPGQSKCIWIMQNDLKGRLIKSIVERMIPTFYLELVNHLKMHCDALNTPNI